MKLVIKCVCLFGMVLFFFCVSVVQVVGVLVGIWDLWGNGQFVVVYCDGVNLQVVEGGSICNYSFGNVVWLVFGVIDIDGQFGVEILVKVGFDLVIVFYVSIIQCKYLVGNVFWVIMCVIDVDNVVGDEVIFSIGNGVCIVFDCICM